MLLSQARTIRRQHYGEDSERDLVDFYNQYRKCEAAQRQQLDVMHRQQLGNARGTGAQLRAFDRACAAREKLGEYRRKRSMDMAMRRSDTQHAVVAEDSGDAKQRATQLPQLSAVSEAGGIDNDAFSITNADSDGAPTVGPSIFAK